MNQDRSYRREYKREKELRRRYGHDLDYGKMFAAQKGVCKLCGKPPKAGGKSLAVDHCHKAGKIRGLLCGPCNLALGQLGDDLAGLGRAVQYVVGPAPRKKRPKRAPRKKIARPPPPPVQPIRRIGWRDRVRAAHQAVGG